jgi:selenide,water dikinase
VDLHILVEKLGLRPDPDVLVGIETLDDAGVYRLRDDLAIVQTVDLLTPPVDDPFLFGQIAAANSLSDVYAMGGRPVTAMNVCCFPVRTVSRDDLERILQGGVDKIQEAGASLVGGHTIRDEDLKYGLSVTGVIHPDRILTNAAARPGDALIQTKPIGSGILVHAVRAKKAAPDALAAAGRSMATLNKAACEVMLRHAPHACTDITGFGVAGHVGQMARASKVTIRLRLSSIPVFPGVLDAVRSGVTTGITKSNRQMAEDVIRFADGVTDEERQLICDPQTSGGLFIALPADRADACLRELRAAGVTDAAIAGEVTAGGPSLEIVR